VGPGSGKVDRSKVTKHTPLTGETTYRVEHGDHYIEVTGSGKGFSEDDAHEYMDGVAAGLDIAPVQKGTTIHVKAVHGGPGGVGDVDTLGWVYPQDMRDGVLNIQANHTALSLMDSLGMDNSTDHFAVKVQGVSIRQAAVVHEYGHVQDFVNGHTTIPHTAYDVKPAPAGAGNISKYAASSELETHAEAFVAHTFGTAGTADPARAQKMVDDFAASYGWKPSTRVKPGTYTGP
jgi:hypothetical protein